MRKQFGDGFALILVLWVLVLLSVIATSFSTSVRVETQAADWVVESSRAEAAVLAGLHRALLGLSVDDSRERWKTSGGSYEFEFDDWRIVVRLQSEGGRVDLNYAPKEILRSLFSRLLQTGSAGELADALIDWRDRDNQRSESGAEALDYLQAGRNYLPANAPLGSVDELSLILGFDETKVALLRPYVTINARQPKLDISAASFDVIAALPGITDEAATLFVEQREATRNDNAPIDTELLDPARQFIVNMPSTILVNLEIQVTRDGFQYREQMVVRLQSGDKPYEVLTRRVLSTEANEL